MAEQCLSQLIDISVTKSEFLLFPQLCKELGLPNDMDSLLTAMSSLQPFFIKAEEQNSYTLQFRSMFLNLKSHLYDAEDMLDNLHTLRNLVAQQPLEGEVDGDLLRRLNHRAELSCSGRKRFELLQWMWPRKSGILVKVVCCCGFVFGYMVFLYQKNES